MSIALRLLKDGGYDATPFHSGKVLDFIFVDFFDG